VLGDTLGGATFALLRRTIGQRFTAR